MCRLFVLLVLTILGLACESPKESPSTRIRVTVESIVDLTPPSPALRRVPLRVLSKQFHERLTRRAAFDDTPETCGIRYAVVLSPSVTYGMDYPDTSATDQDLSGPTQSKTSTGYRSEWSSLIGMRDEGNGLHSHIDVSRSDRMITASVPADLNNHLAQSAESFRKKLNSTLAAFDVPLGELPKFYASATVAQQKLLLERLSLCPTPEHDTWLGHALKNAKDDSLKFRIVGLIGERKVDALGDILIDMVDLNHIEWTRTLVRTLSILKHHRARQLFRILSVHESPLLQKELKTAIDRLERREKIP